MSAMPGQAGELDPYAAKRDPRRTPEPFGADLPAPPRLRRFAVQQHAARRLHFDLRLEASGVLKSFALPKGPPAVPGERRLAVPTEDHPADYLEFEGMIPEGQYGAGAVIVWDRGTYEVAGDTRPEDGIAAGKLSLILRGEKLAGGFELVRLRARKEEAGTEPGWLMIRRKEPGEGPFAAQRELRGAPTPEVALPPGSVLTGYDLDDLAAAAGRASAAAAELRLAGARTPAPDLAAVEPALPGARERPFSSADWLFEVKWDGARVLAARDGPRVRAIYRGGRDASRAFPEVVQAVRALPAERAVVDGEVCVLDDQGRPDFHRLQDRFHASDPRDVARLMARAPVVYYVFDLLALGDLDLRPVALERRKAILRELLPRTGRRLRYSDHVLEDGEALFRVACERGLEGVLAKRRAGPYRGGRSGEWLKIKRELRQSVVLIGFTAGHGDRERLGALHLACLRGGRLAYAGKVGSGFDAEEVDRLLDLLAPLARPDPPPAQGLDVASAGPSTWIEPRIVCEVRFARWTDDGVLREPVYLGIRPDVDPAQCADERERDAAPPPEGEGGGEPAEPPAEETPPPPPAAGVAPALSGLRDPRSLYPLSNPRKLIWPEDGVRKLDLRTYYIEMAPFLLPYLADRPLTVVRYPDGIGGKMFFQKAPPQGAPPWLRTVEVPDDESPGKNAIRMVCDDERTLAYLANLAAVVLHIPSVRLSAGGRPDWLVLDLDPREAPFPQVVDVALAARAILSDLGLESAIKTSGATGLHVLVPLGAAFPPEAARYLAELLARVVETARPDIATTRRPVGERAGRVYVDFGQNLRRTIASPFSPRARPGAPVSTPLRWAEVTPHLLPSAFTMRTVPDRVRAAGDPLRVVLGPGPDPAAVLARIEARLRAGS